MASSIEGFISQTHDKLRGFVKSLINNRSTDDDGLSFQTIYLEKFISDILRLIEGRLEAKVKEDADAPAAILALEHNYKDLWTLLDLLKKDSRKQVSHFEQNSFPRIQSSEPRSPVNDDPETRAMEQFFRSFDVHYDELATDIYLLNAEQNLQRLEDKLDLENLPRQSSLSLISLLIKTSPWLSKLSTVVECLKAIQFYDHDSMLKRIEVFQQPAFLQALQNFDFSNDFMSGVQGEQFRQLYEFLAEVISKRDFSQAHAFLELIFGELDHQNPVRGHNRLGLVLANILNGGLPFHNFDFEEFSGKNWTSMYGGNQLGDFEVLDYMKTRNFQQMQRQGIKASKAHGNHNWLLWQQSLYMSAKNAKTQAEQTLFGLLCNDSSFSNQSQSLSFESSLFQHFRAYLNNEVMRRYIVVRKILQKHHKIVLFNEPSFVESKFDTLNPLELLNFIYPKSGAHCSFVSRDQFIESLAELANEPSSWSKNIHFVVLFDFMDRDDHKEPRRIGTRFQQKIHPRKLSENFSKWLSLATSSKHLPNSETVSQAKNFVTNQNMLLTLPLMNMLSPAAFEALSALIRDSYAAYESLFSSPKEIVNAPLVFACGNYFFQFQSSSFEPIDPTIQEQLEKLLTEVTDSQVLKFLKDEIEFHFGHGKQLLAGRIPGLAQNKSPQSALEHCQKVFINAAQKAAFFDQEAGTAAQIGQQSLQGSAAGRRNSLELVIGDNIDFYQALQILMEIFRLHMISKRFNDASELMVTYINPFLVKNLEKVRSLDESDESLDTKSLLREKELCSRLLDSVAKSDDFSSSDRLKKSRSFGVASQQIFGINPALHLLRVHQDCFDTLSQVLFLDPRNWIFDFFDYVGPDQKRRQQLALLRETLVKFILLRIVTVVENCSDKKLQYDEMQAQPLFAQSLSKKLILCLRESDPEVLNENRELVKTVVTKLTAFMRVNEFAFKDLIQYQVES